MKTNEILLASGVIGVVSGVLGAFGAHFFLGGDARLGPRTAPPVEGVPTAGGAAPSTEVLRALDDLRMGDVSLASRLDAIEAQLMSVATRTPVETSGAYGDPARLAADTPARIASMLGDGGVSSPEFVQTVGKALEEIRAQEDAEREARRSEQQLQRIEDRVTRLQDSLGLNASQTRDLRTAFLTQEEKREALFATMRDGGGDPGTVRESMRTLRDDTNNALQGFLTADQYATYQETERDDFRGGFGGGGSFGGGRGGGGGADGNNDRGGRRNR